VYLKSILSKVQNTLPKRCFLFKAKVYHSVSASGKPCSERWLKQRTGKGILNHCGSYKTKIGLQYSSQVASWVHALRGMWTREKLARAQGAFEELRAKLKPLESWTIANLPARLLSRVLAQSWYSPYIKFTSQNIVTCGYNISVPYTECDCYAGASSRNSSHL